MAAAAAHRELRVDLAVVREGVQQASQVAQELPTKVIQAVRAPSISLVEAAVVARAPLAQMLQVTLEHRAEQDHKAASTPLQPFMPMVEVVEVERQP